MNNKRLSVNAWLVIVSVLILVAIGIVFFTNRTVINNAF